MSNRSDYIDWLKGFAIFTVVLGHCWTKTYAQYWMIYRFHMVLFMAISGYLFNGRRNFKDFFLKKVRSLLVPYVIFSVVSIAATVLFLNRGRTVSEYISAIVLGGKFCSYYNNFTLWYLPLIFVVSLIMYFVVRLPKKWYFAVMAAAFVISVPVNNLSRVFFDNNFIPFSFQVIPSALVCMMVGYGLKNAGYEGVVFKNRHVNAIAAVVIGLAGFAINIGRRDTIINVCSYLYLPSAIMICHMLVNLTRKSYNKILSFMGKNSLYIFGTHRIILHLLEKRTSLEAWFEAVRITGFTASLFISISVILVICIFIVAFKYLKNFMYSRRNAVKP